MIWQVTTKGDPRCRALADAHYTRQTVGHPQWTRPGYSAVLFAASPLGNALFVWWRPKWEDGRPGTARKDGLRVIECTHFRREPGASLPVASEMIREAVAMLGDDRVCAALHLHAAGRIEGLLTGVGSAATARGRSKHAEPGVCFRAAGWQQIEKRGGRADVWLWHPAPCGSLITSPAFAPQLVEVCE